MRFTGEVGDAKTTAEIEKTDRRGRSLRQSQCKLETFALGFDDRFGFKILRAGKQVEAFERQSGSTDFSQQFGNLLGVDAELLGSAAHLHARTFQLEIGIDAGRNARLAARAAIRALLDVSQLSDFAKGFDIDQYAGCNCLSQLLATFSGAGKADVSWICTAVEGNLQFAARGHINAVDQRCHVAHQRRHRVGLHRIVQLNRRRQRGAQLRYTIGKQFPVIGIKRCLPDALCEAGERDSADDKFAITDGELSHRRMQRGLVGLAFVD